MASGKMNYQDYKLDQDSLASLVDSTVGWAECNESHHIGTPGGTRGARPTLQRPSLTRRVVIAACLLTALAGCQAVVNPYDARVTPPVPEEIAIGREMSKVSLPAYRIEPPDVVSIEMLKLIPLPPYRAEVFDVLQIRANAPPDQPI